METILVTGGSGLVGRAIKDLVSGDINTDHFIFLSSKDANLCNYEETKHLFDTLKPSIVIHLAACVGGLFKNMNNNVLMYESNEDINRNVLRCCVEYNVKKCVSVLSTCIFPDKTTYPINEMMLHNGPPHSSNLGYATAKRNLEILSRLYRQESKCTFVTVIPTNIFGPYDNYNLENAHVIPALIHKCHLAKQKNANFVVAGSGAPLRQFIFNRDLAKLIMWVTKQYTDHEPLILSVDDKHEVSIHNVATKIADHFGYAHRLVMDTSKADGQFKKTADNTKMKSLYKKSMGKSFEFTLFDEALAESITWFVENFEIARK